MRGVLRPQPQYSVIRKEISPVLNLISGIPVTPRGVITTSPVLPEVALLPFSSMISEIIDENGNKATSGGTGEVVITPLGVTGMPLIRFRTGDISFLITEYCGCGRRTPRIGPILGRKNQMLKFKGTTLFPSAILSVVEGIEGVDGACIEARKNDDGTDNVILYVYCKNPPALEKAIVDNLRARIRVVPEISFISEKELNHKIYHPERRKKISFIDFR